MAKIRVYDAFITGNLFKFLYYFGYVPQEVNMHLYVREKFRHQVRFWMDAFLSGLIIWGALVAPLYFFGIFFNIPLLMHLPLIFSYGLITDVLGRVNLFKKNVEVVQIGK